MWKQKKQWSKQNDNFAFKTYRFYTILYITLTLTSYYNAENTFRSQVITA